jgi:hypothetical protein
MKFFILTIFFVLSDTDKSPCETSIHTAFFNDNYGKVPISDFFLIQSYNNSDLCISNSEFIEPDRHYIPPGTLFQVEYADYDVEYIIDSDEGDLSKCKKNIIGNLILSNSIWNRQLDKLCWDYAKEEKMIIYSDIFSQALNNVRKCCTASIAPESIIIPIASLIFVIVLFIFMLVVWCTADFKCCKRKKYDYVRPFESTVHVENPTIN